jgi:hypothetical protein
VATLSNARCVGSDCILANRAIRVWRNRFQRLNIRLNLLGRWHDYYRVQEVSGEIHGEQCRCGRTTHSARMKAIYQLEVTDFIHEETAHDGIARLGAQSIHRLRKKIITAFH